MSFTERQLQIVRAALHELDIRLCRGLANSHLDAATFQMLRKPRLIHDSEVSELLKRMTI